MLKGHSKIELFDAKSRKRVHVQEKDNMVTNALSKVYSCGIDGFSYLPFPMVGNTLGGILLFPNTLTEDANNIYAPSTNYPVGYASNDVNSGANIYRGSMNQTESGVIDNGYKFVWDFSTSQANGTISALSLTHKNGGANYYGSIDSTTIDTIFPSIAHRQSSEDNSMVKLLNMMCIVEIDATNNIVYSIVPDYGTGKLTIKKFVANISSVHLNKDILYNIVSEDTVITPSVFLFTGVYGSVFNYSFLDGKDGYWCGFEGDGNTSGNASIVWIKIKKSDYTFTEGTWTLTNIHAYPLGYYASLGNSSYTKRNQYCALRNGYLYFFNKEVVSGSSLSNGIYKLNISNTADISLIQSSANLSAGEMVNINDIIICNKCIVDGNNIIHQTGGTIELNGCQLCMSGVYGLRTSCFSNGANFTNQYLRLIPQYLATINNIAPVTKTADKTMKITYTVAES